MNIKQSVGRLLAQKKTIMRLFYDSFLTEFPEVRRHFSGVDLDEQAVVLTTALLVVEANFSHHDSAATRHYLRILGDRHRVLGIPADLFPKFCEATLENSTARRGGAP